MRHDPTPLRGRPSRDVSLRAAAKRTLVARLATEGKEAFTAPDPDALAEALLPRLSEGDVVVVMSSGAFGGLCGKLVQALATREVAAV